MKRVYISGRISGLPEPLYTRYFADAEKLLLSMGYKPYNPTKRGIVPGYKWEDYMKEDIKVLCDCDAIYFLPNWMDSKGAVMEHDIAKKLSIPTIEVYKA